MILRAGTVRVSSSTDQISLDDPIMTDCKGSVLEGIIRALTEVID